MKTIIAATLLVILSSQEQLTFGNINKCAEKLQQNCPEKSECYTEINSKCYGNKQFQEKEQCKTANDYYSKIKSELKKYEDQQTFPTPDELKTHFDKYEKVTLNQIHLQFKQGNQHYNMKQTTQTTTAVNTFISEYTINYNAYNADKTQQNKIVLQQKYEDQYKVRRLVFDDQKIPEEIQSKYIICNRLCYDSLSQTSQTKYKDTQECFHSNISKQQVETIYKQAKISIDGSQTNSSSLMKAFLVILSLIFMIYL